MAEAAAGAALVRSRSHVSVMRSRKVRWHSLLALVRTSAATAELMGEARGRRRFEEAQQELELDDENGSEDAELKVVFELSEESERAFVPYSQQADRAMNTVQAFEQRQRHRRHPLVREALHLWWSWALATVQHGAGVGAGAGLMGGAATTLSRALYMRMHCALYLELLDEGEEYEEAEALSAAEADFLRDAGGASEVSRPQVSPPAPRLLASWPARVRSRALVGRMYNMHMYM